MMLKKLAVLALLTFAAAPLSAADRPLVLALGGEPETGFDPLMGWGSYGNPLFQSTLLRRTATLETAPDLALSHHLSNDRLTWTITLRPDVRFSDGTPLTAADVAFTFNRAKTAGGEVDLQDMVNAEATGRYEVQFTLSRPRITFTDAFYTLGIVPAASYGSDYARNPIGSGPYKLVSWSQGAQLLVEKNPYYYGKSPDFSPLTFLFTGADAGLAAARAGVAHVASAPGPLADALPEGFRQVAAPTVDNRGISLPHLPRSQKGGQAVGHNVTSDPAIRRAINLGLDRNLLIDVALQGQGTPAFGPADGLPWSRSDERITFDPEAAAALLDEAGWKMGANGQRQKGDLTARFALHYPSSDPTRQVLAEVTAELLRPLGISVEPKGGSWPEIRRVMASEPVVFGFGPHSPLQVYSLFASELGGVGYANPIFYNNPQVEALFAQAQKAESLEASFPIWREAQAHYGLQGDMAWAWLANINHVYFVQNCLEIGTVGIEPHGHGWPLTAGLADWEWTCE